MATLREEIADITTTLFQIQMERDNLLKALRAQEENFNHYFKLYQDKYEALLKEKNETNNILMQDNARLFAHLRGENAPVPQYKY